MLVFSSLEITQSPSVRGCPCHSPAYRSKIGPALASNAGSRGKIQCSYCQGFRPSSCSNRQTVLRLIDLPSVCWTRSVKSARDCRLSGKPVSELPEAYRANVNHMGKEKTLVQAIRDEGEAGRGLAVAGFAREILQKGSSSGQKELEARLATLPRDVADDANIIYKAMNGQELTQTEARRLFALPEDLHAKIRPGMTVDEVVDVAKLANATPVFKPASPLPGTGPLA